MLRVLRASKGQTVSFGISKYSLLRAAGAFLSRVVRPACLQVSLAIDLSIK